MAERNPKRETHFPAIEKRYGEKMAYWFKVLAKLKGEKYPVQMAFLQENYGFSRTHANALIMYSRGSESAKRHSSITEYYKTISPVQAKTLRKIFKVIRLKYPKMEHVIAWNQPMLRIGTFYVFGAGAAKNHILINPFSKTAIDNVMAKYPNYKRNKHTVQLPNAWEVDEKLLLALVRARLAEQES